jgi:alkylated DNA repair dioxygenase AlkB
MAHGAAQRSAAKLRVHPALEGFQYQPDLLSAEQERRLLERFADLPFRNFEFHGYFGKRRTVSFGWQYDFTGRGLQKAGEMPAFLLHLRESAAKLAETAPSDLQHALVTEYPPGAGLGWHKDKAVFGQVVGISLCSPCTFRFRRKARGAWERWSVALEPRSAYLLTGAARTEWEHSIPAVDSLRYSVTFRSLRSSA